MQVQKIVDAVGKYRDRMVRGTWFRLDQGRPRYCVVTALLHEAGMMNYEFMMACDAGDDAARMWEMNGSLLKTHFGVASLDEMLRLVEINNSAPSDDSIFESLVTTLVA